MGDDQNYLVCSLVATMADPALGSIVAPCSRCGQAAWVSPSGQNILAKKAALVLCVPCGDRRIREDDEAEIMPLNAEQVAEIKSEIAKRRA